MSIPDPVTTGIVTAAALQAAKQGQEFIAAAAGHPGESLGTILGNLGRRRMHNAEAVGNKAHLTLLNIGVRAQEVPLNILQPLLESASLQEDPSLQAIWANLLANAADPRQQNKLEPVFTDILRGLSSRDVRFLDELMTGLGNVETLELSEVDLANLYIKAGIARYVDFPNIGLSTRLLTADNILGSENCSDFYRMMDIFELYRILLKLPRVRENHIQEYVFTQLGRDFLRACRKPKA